MSIHHQDIIIIGGGSAGVAAAVSAAQEGLSVTIIEKNSLDTFKNRVGAIANKTTELNWINQYEFNAIIERFEY